MSDELDTSHKREKFYADCQSLPFVKPEEVLLGNVYVTKSNKIVEKQEMIGAVEAMKIYLGQTVYKKVYLPKIFYRGRGNSENKRIIAQELLRNGSYLFKLP